MKTNLKMRSFSFLVGLLSFFFLNSLASPAASGQITLLFLDDLHSQLLPLTQKVHTTTVSYGGLVYAAQVIREEKQKNPDAFVLQGGDAVSGIMWLHFFGEPEFSALEKTGVQAKLLGNHEFNYGLDHLSAALEKTAIPVIASNLSFDDAFMKERVAQTLLLKSGGTVLGVLGLASPTLFTQASPGEKVHLDRDLEHVASSAVRQLRDRGAHIIVALSRLPEQDNIELASRVKGIHAILGSSSHEKMDDYLMVEGPERWATLLAETEAYGTFVGRLDLATDAEGRVSEEGTRWTLLPATPEAVGPHKEVQAIAQAFEDKLNRALLVTLGFSENYADARTTSLRSDENGLANVITDALRWRFKTDIAMINAGGVRGDRIFPSGNLSWKILSEILPFRNAIHIVALSGEQIRQLLEVSLSALIGPDDAYDPDTRIHTGGLLHFSGLRVRCSLSGKPTLVDPDGRLIRWGNRLEEVSFLQGGTWVPLDKDRIYTVAVNSWTAGGGDRLFVFREGTREKTDILDIEAVVDYLLAQPGQRVRFAKDGRLSIPKP